MNKINKFLVLFFFFVFLLTGLLWQFLQSDYFSSSLSEKITKRISKVLQADFEFKKMKIQFFPPATFLQEVKIIGQNKKRTIEINASSFGIYLSLLAPLSNKLAIEKIRIEDGELIIHNTTKSISKKKSSFDIPFYHKRFLESIKIPLGLNKFEISDMDVQIDNNIFLIEKGLFQLSKKLLNIRLSIYDISIPEESQIKKFINGKSVEAHLNLLEKRLEVKDFKIRDGLNIYKYKGNILKEKEKITFPGHITYEGDINSMLQSIDIKEKINGWISLNAHIKKGHDMNSMEFDYSTHMDQFESPWGQFETIKLKGVKKQQYLYLNSFNIKDKKSTANLISKTILYNFKNRKILQNGIQMNLEDFFTNKALYVIRESLDILKGRMSGTMKASYTNGIISFDIHQGFKLKDFRLINNSNVPILSNPSLTIDTGRVDILEHGGVDIAFKFHSKNSSIDFEGHIGEEISLKAKKNPIDLMDFQPISGIKLKGKGMMSMEVKGPSSDTIIIFDSSLEDALVSGYNLGNVKSILNLYLGRGTMEINKMIGQYGKSSYQGIGVLDFWNNGIDLYLRFKDSVYKELFHIFDPLAHKISPYLKDISFEYDANYRIWGQFRENGINAKGDLLGRDILWKGEYFNSLSGNFNHENGKFIFNNGLLKKSKGTFNFKTSYEFSKKEFKYDISFNKIPIGLFNYYKIFNLGFESEMKGYLKGRNKNNNIFSDIKINFQNSTINDRTVSDSILHMNLENSLLNIKGSFLRDIFILNSKLDLSNNRRSNLKASINTDEIRVFAELLSSHNIKTKTVNGLMKAKLKSDFKLDNIEKMNLEFNMEEFNFKKDMILLEGKGDISIKNGYIKAWEILLDGEDGYIKSIGKGNLTKEYNIKTNFDISPEVFELITPKIQRIGGRLNGDLTLQGNKKDYNILFISSGKINSMKIDKIPSLFEDITYQLQMDGEEFFLQRLEGRYGKGKIKMDGNIQFQSIPPKLSLEFSLDNCLIPLTEVSNVLASGKGKISGNEIPYIISGDFSILHGNILNEFDEITSIGKNQFKHTKFIPQKYFDKKANYFLYDIQVYIPNTIYLKNKFAELDFNGNLKIKGSSNNLFFNGFLKTASNKSKLIFKGHEFNLSKGQIDFKDNPDKKEPVINFNGSSKINEYLINLDLKGTPQELKLLLKSDPSLSQQDILSLLTLGITREKSDQLEESDKQSVISVGLGNLLADQLEIGKDLNTSLGIRFSILPELGEDKSSKIQGKEATKLKSSTKIKIEKQIAEKIDLSVSSTVGGTLEQKKEVNVKWNLNDNLSVQGVYESRSSNHDEESSNASESIGFDFIFKRTYE